MYGAPVFRQKSSPHRGHRVSTIRRVNSTPNAIQKIVKGTNSASDRVAIITIQLAGISAIHQAVTARWRLRIRRSAAPCSGVGGSHRGKYFRVAITGPIAPFRAGGDPASAGLAPRDGCGKARFAAPCACDTIAGTPQARKSPNRWHRNKPQKPPHRDR